MLWIWACIRDPDSRCRQIETKIWVLLPRLKSTGNRIRSEYSRHILVRKGVRSEQIRVQVQNLRKISQDKPKCNKCSNRGALCRLRFRKRVNREGLPKNCPVSLNLLPCTRSVQIMHRCSRVRSEIPTRSWIRKERAMRPCQNRLYFLRPPKNTYPDKQLYFNWNKSL